MSWRDEKPWRIRRRRFGREEERTPHEEAQLWLANLVGYRCYETMTT